MAEPGATTPWWLSPWLVRAAVVVAVARVVTQVGVLPFLPVLIPDHLPTVIALRPGKEFLLLASGLSASTGRPSVAAAVLAFVPMGVLAAWAYFLVGRAYAPNLRRGDGPDWLTRMLPPERLELAEAVLARRGAAVAVLARLAAVPPSATAAAAGATGMSGRRFLAADLAGSVLALSITVGAGLALGAAYEAGQRWLTVAGLAVFVGIVVLLSRWVRHEASRIAMEAEPELAAHDPLVADE